MAQKWRLEFSFHSLRLAVFFECKVAIQVIPAKGEKVETEPVEFEHQHQPANIARKLAMEVEAERGESFKLTLNVLVRVRETKKCAGVIELDLKEYSSGNNFNFRLQSPLAKCPDPSAMLAFEFRCLPLNGQTFRPQIPASPFQNIYTRPTGPSIRRRDDSSSSDPQAKLRSVSPANVKVHFGQSANKSASGTKLLWSDQKDKINRSLGGDPRGPQTSTAIGRTPPTIRPPISPFAPSQSQTVNTETSMLSASQIKDDTTKPSPRIEVRTVQDPELLAIKAAHELCAPAIEQLKTTITTLEERVKEYRDQLHSKELEDISREKRNEGSEKRIAALEKNLYDMTQKLTDLESQLSQKEQEAFETRTAHFQETTHLRDQASKVESQLDLASREKEAFKARFEEAEKQLQALQEELVLRAKAPPPEPSESAEELESLRTELAQLKKDYDLVRKEKLAVEMRAGAFDGDRARRDEEVKREKKQRIEIEKRLHERENELFEKETELENLRKKVEELEAKSRDSELQNHAKAADDFQAERAKAEAELADLRTRLQKSEGQNAEVSQKISSLEKDLESKSEQIFELQRKGAQRSVRDSTEFDDFAVTLAENESLKKKIRQLEYSLGEKQSESSSLGELKKSFKDQQEQLSVLKETLKQDRLSLEKKITELQKERDVQANLAKETERKLFVYVKKLGDALNFVQELRMNKEHQEQIIQMLI